MNLFSSTNRRTFLRNGTNALTLPFLASLLPAGSRAFAEQSLSSGASKRLLWMAMGHGHMEKHFYPTESGRLSDIALPPGWGPMKKNLNQVTMVSNFTNAENKQPHEGTEAVLTCVNVVGFFPARLVTTAFPAIRLRRLTWDRRRVIRVCSLIVKTVIPAMGTAGWPCPIVRTVARCLDLPRHWKCISRFLVAM